MICVQFANADSAKAVFDSNDYGGRVLYSRVITFTNTLLDTF